MFMDSQLSVNAVVSSPDVIGQTHIKIAHKHEVKARTEDICLDENVTFADLGLDDVLIKGLSRSGFEKPSPIQLSAIPFGRCGLDLVVQAKSGTGKTCVFSIIALESVDLAVRSPQVLMLAPTREIALQIEEVVKGLGSAMKNLVCHSAIGGLSFKEDKDKVKKAHIIIGTPGRVKHLMTSSALDTSSVRLFVLDEADKLLEEGFQDQINWVYSGLPESKQLVAASATYTEELVQHLCNYMHNPTFVRLNSNDPVLIGVRQYKKLVGDGSVAKESYDNKVTALVDILSHTNFQQCLVFSNLITRAENLSKLMESRGWPTTHIAGSQEQEDRIKAITKLKTYDCRILVSTDLTSRGIDADRIDLVVNLDLPYDHETYLHRVGRAGRFGAKGAAITLYTQAESVKLDKIAELINTTIQPLPEKLDVDFIENPQELLDVKRVAQVESFQIINKREDEKTIEPNIIHSNSGGTEANVESNSGGGKRHTTRTEATITSNAACNSGDIPVAAMENRHVNGGRRREETGELHSVGLTRNVITNKLHPPLESGCRQEVVSRCDNTSAHRMSSGEVKAVPAAGNSNEVTDNDMENKENITPVVSNKHVSREIISHRPPFNSLKEALDFVQNPEKCKHFLNTNVVVGNNTQKIGSDAKQANVTQADVTQADVTQADATQVDATQADATQADVAQADVTRSSIRKPPIHSVSSLIQTLQADQHKDQSSSQIFNCETDCRAKSTVRQYTADSANNVVTTSKSEVNGRDLVSQWETTGRNATKSTMSDNSSNYKKSHIHSKGGEDACIKPDQLVDRAHYANRQYTSSKWSGKYTDRTYYNHNSSHCSRHCISSNIDSHHGYRVRSSSATQDTLRCTLDAHYRQVYLQHSYILGMARNNHVEHKS